MNFAHGMKRPNSWRVYQRSTFQTGEGLSITAASCNDRGTAGHVAATAAQSGSLSKLTPKPAYVTNVISCTHANTNHGTQLACVWRGRLAPGPTAHPAENTNLLQPVIVPVPPLVRCCAIVFARELFGGCSLNTAKLMITIIKIRAIELLPHGGATSTAAASNCSIRPHVMGRCTPKRRVIKGDTKEAKPVGIAREKTTRLTEDALQPRSISMTGRRAMHVAKE
mmetsp:Transcript_49307/g.81856  ORF Transcript_49307/g.81856 Transcript_49307/m.81856 type:complete len:224 (-) Transcript_49307:893-1564(-)